MKSGGIVYLVGAGPGDPDLITVKGRRHLRSADAVVYDRLVDRRLLMQTRADARLIDVGKIPGSRKNRQSDINTLLIELAAEGLNVVRLKGGDPFVFGRGGEEAEALRAAGLPFEVVPGISSAVAAAAYAGIPITHRGVASSFTVVTGNEAPGKPESAIQWEHLARQGGTLVVLMGWESLRGIVDALVHHGRPSDTPVALVQWGTEPHQRTVTGTLSDIADKAAEASLKPPVVAVIGEVVNLRERLRWFDTLPMFGKRVLVTRTRAQASTLSALLSDRGAMPIELPTIEVRKLEDYGRLDSALGAMDSQDWLIFTSVNAVDAVSQRMTAMALDARSLHSVQVGAIGAATAARLRGIGIAADFVPDSFQSDAIVAGLAERGLSGKRVLLPRTDIAPEALTDGLTSLGAVVDSVEAYRTVTPAESSELVAEVFEQGFDVATFTSSSTVTNLCGLINGKIERLSEATVACIGPVTAATARELGVKVDIVAEQHTVPGLMAALDAYYSR